MSGETEQHVSGWTVDTLKEFVERRFSEMGVALELKSEEYQRRLDALNHAHEQAREKERDFIGREAFETFVERTGSDFSTLRTEIRVTSDAVNATKAAAADALAIALKDQSEKNEARFGKIENVQAKMIGALMLSSFFVPAVTSLIVYLLTRTH